MKFSKKQIAKSESGLTLLMLTITVIIMLIIASATIFSITGKEEIINQTRIAVNQADEQAIIDDVQIAVSKLAVQWDGDGTIQTYIISKIREKGEDGYITENNAKVTCDETGILTYKDSKNQIVEIENGVKKLKINEDGKIEIGKILPETIQQVEYIESTGTQYIDTSIYFDFSQDFRIIGIVNNPDTSTRKVILGSYKDDSTNSCSYSFEFGGSSNSNPGRLRNYFRKGNSFSSFFNSGSQIPANKLISYNTFYNAATHTVYTEYNYDNTTNSYGDNVLNVSGVSVKSLRFFLDYRDNPSSIANTIKIGKTQIYKNNILVGDFIPCYCTQIVTDVDGKTCPSGTIGLYDLFQNQFYTNKGTGTFLKGADVKKW